MPEEFNPSDWITQDEIANLLNVPIAKVWEKVRNLAPAQVIRTRSNPMNRRQTLVHKDDIEIIRRAIFAA